MTVQTWLTDWLSLHKSEKRLKPRTVESYESLLRLYVFPILGGISLEELQPLDVRHLLARILDSGHERTAEMVWVMLKCAFKDWEGGDPMHKVPKPKHHQISPEPWSDEEMMIYFRALDDHPHGLPLLLVLLLGLRRGEVCGLRWRDVDLVNGQIHIVNQRIQLSSGQVIDAPPKSFASVRWLPLPAPLIGRLKAAQGLPDAYLCALLPNGLGQAHKALTRRLGLRHIPLHGLRHSMATSCIRHGGEMRALQALLGHSSYTVTANKYTHPDMPIKQTALDAACRPWYTVLHTPQPQIHADF